jgi:hypothetical protein
MHSGRAGSFFPNDRKKDDSQLTKISHDATKTTVEQVKDIATQVSDQPHPRKWNILQPL